MLTLLGIIILITPIILIFFLFEDKIKSFSYSLIITTSFYLTTSIVTQYFNIFNYKNIIFINLFFVLIVFIIFIFKKKYWSIALSPLVLGGFILIFVQLYLVHYQYTGTITTITGQQQVSNFSYSLPKFSDEWIAAGLIKYSINEGGLPLVNPLNKNEFFLNPLFVFHSFLANLFLILSLDPILDFSAISILINIFICISVFMTLRCLGANNKISIISTLFIPLISQAAMLPGIWFLLPYNLSLIFLIMFFCGLLLNSIFIYSFSFFLSFVFYPPIIIFSLPAFIFYLYNKNKTILILIIAFFISTLIFEIVRHNFFRENLDGGILQLPFLHIFPIILIPFVVLGFYLFFKKRNFIISIPTLVGLLFWVFYTFYPNVVIIEFPRIAIITSILLIVCAGFGINFFNKYINIYTTGIIFIFFILITVFYPIQGELQRLHIYTKPFDKNKTIFISLNTPLTSYLTREEMSIFESKKNKTIMAPPWKGLAVGIFSESHPLQSKGSTIGNNFLSYYDFMNSSCEEKNAYSKKYKIDYVYSAYFDCPGFILETKTGEGLRLYSVQISY